MQRTLRTSRTSTLRLLCGPVLAVAALSAAGCDAGTPAAPDAEAPTRVAAPDVPTATPLPAYDPHSTTGRLVDGFPADLVPVPPGAHVLASSAKVPDGTALHEVTLSLNCAESVEALGAFYAQAFTAQGFVAAPTTAPSGLTALGTYVRPGAAGGPLETVVVGIYDDGTTRLVTVRAEIAPPPP